MTITYPDVLPAGVQYWKYDRRAASWYALDPGRYVVNGNTITLFLTDGEAGDHDYSVNGFIIDPGGPVVCSRDCKGSGKGGKGDGKGSGRGDDKGSCKGGDT